MNLETIEKVYKVVADVTGIAIERIKGTSSVFGDARGIVYHYLRTDMKMRPSDIAAVLDKNRSNVASACRRIESVLNDDNQLRDVYKLVQERMESYLILCHDTDAELFRAHGKLKQENKSLKQENQFLREQLAESKLQLKIVKSAYNIAV